MPIIKCYCEQVYVIEFLEFLELIILYECQMSEILSKNMSTMCAIDMTLLKSNTYISITLCDHTDREGNSLPFALLYRSITINFITNLLLSVY